MGGKSAERCQLAAQEGVEVTSSHGTDGQSCRSSYWRLGSFWIRKLVSAEVTGCAIVQRQWPVGEQPTQRVHLGPEEGAESSFHCEVSAAGERRAAERTWG